jgi:hypothetical protein
LTTNSTPQSLINFVVWICFWKHDIRDENFPRCVSMVNSVVSRGDFMFPPKLSIPFTS